MSNVRTVRLLDRRPGEGPQEPLRRVVRGFEIETNIPIPDGAARDGALVEAIGALLPGESFVHKTNASDARVKFKGRKFTSRKLSNGGFRIWRLK